MNHYYDILKKQFENDLKEGNLYFGEEKRPIDFVEEERVIKKKNQEVEFQRNQIEENLKNGHDREIELREFLFKNRNKVDVLFVQDCTGSMDEWITECKQSTGEVAISFREKYPDFTINFGFIGYRDYPHNKLQVIESTEDVDDFIAKMEGVKTGAGGDVPEDIASALDYAAKLVSSAHFKLLIHITDAPCHGKQYHSEEIRDSYDEGDPYVDIENVVAVLATKVDYYFCTLSQDTKIMTDIFQRIYDSPKSRKKFEVVNNLMEEGVRAFKHVVFQSIETSTVQN